MATNKSNKTTYLLIAGIVAVGGVIAFLMIRKKRKAQLDLSYTPTPSGGGSSSGGSYSGRGFPLKKGSGGAKVKALQRYLNDVGSYGLVVDGKFGNLTEGAVKEELGGGIKTISETYYKDFVEEYE